MSELVVADTTVWSNFAHAGDPRRVVAAFPGVASPRAVIDEIEVGVRRGYLAGHDWSFVEEIALDEGAAERARQLGVLLGRGEAASIAIAEARGALLLTDDRIARKLARAAGVRVSGTLGALVRIVDSGVISLHEADRLLGRMIAAGYRCPVSSLGELL